MKRRRKDGDEQDLFSRWRHWVSWRPGERARIRRQVHKRERREGRVLDVWIGSCCVCACEHDHQPNHECVMCRWCVCSEHRKDTKGASS